jgi:hypothetical protein
VPNWTAWASRTARQAPPGLVHAADIGAYLWILGPPRLHPQPTWTGLTEEALAVLRELPDDAGPDAFWNRFA